MLCATFSNSVLLTIVFVIVRREWFKIFQNFWNCVKRRRGCKELWDQGCSFNIPVQYDGYLSILGDMMESRAQVSKEIMILHDCFFNGIVTLLVNFPTAICSFMSVTHWSLFKCICWEICFKFTLSCFFFFNIAFHVNMFTPLLVFFGVFVWERHSTSCFLD